ncbi:hypothetical protein JKP88DRAFT_26504 [Tribonema minus]|uniref:Transmembrane protein n=1 Tax=Tribonema minus TaxID=303371 RepID=A0A835Z781_9STRA|nr:hypothetical protein JKP88DRAFT_26504 [Tribonema minus]
MRCASALVVLVCVASVVQAFTAPRSASISPRRACSACTFNGVRAPAVWRLAAVEEKDSEAAEKQEQQEEPASVDEPVAPPAVDLMKSVNFQAPAPAPAEESDAVTKARVLVYIVLSLVPILFLLPLMSSKEMIPLDPELLQQQMQQR